MKQIRLLYTYKYEVTSSILVASSRRLLPTKIFGIPAKSNSDDYSRIGRVLHY